MKKVLALSVLALFVIGYSGATFAQTTETNSRPQPPQFSQNGGQSLQMNSENAKGQFDGRRPKYKPDSQPGGKMEPKEWDSSSDSNFQGGQPPQMKDGMKNGLKDGLKNGLKNGQINGQLNGTQKSE